MAWQSNKETLIVSNTDDIKTAVEVDIPDDLTTIITSIDGVYDSSAVIANKDGNVYERTEYIIANLLNTQPINVLQSAPIAPDLDIFGVYSVLISDVNYIAIPAVDITLDSATILLEQSRAGSAFSAVGITQPTLTKSAGQIKTTFLFTSTAGQWATGDLYRLTISGVIIENSPDYTLQTFIWNNVIPVTSDIDSEVDFIVTAVTLPDIDSTSIGTTIGVALGRKGDTPKTGTTASAMNILKSLVESNFTRRCNVTNVNVDNLHFTSTDFPTSGTATFVGWYAYCHQNGYGTNTAPRAEYRLISAFDNATGIFTHAAFSAPLTTSSKMLIIHPTVYDTLLIKAETDKIASIVTDLTLPIANTANKATIADTIGNKDDTIAGTSSIALAKQALAAIAVVDLETDKIAGIKTTVDLITGYALATDTALEATLKVPTADVVTNTTVSQVVGNKTDAAVVTVGVTKSIVAYVKGILTNLNLVKTETDKIPATIVKIDAEVVKTAAIKTETDKIPAEVVKTAAIKTETDKIPATITKVDSIKTTVEAITGYALDSTVAKANILGAAISTSISADIQVIDAVVDLIKTDTTSILAKQNARQSVYPTLADGITVTGGAAWTLGNFATIAAANAITSAFTIKGVNIASASANDTYELVLYSGALGAEVEIGRTRFTRVSNTYQIGFSSIPCTPLAANTRISAKVASSTGGDNCTISILYNI